MFDLIFSLICLYLLLIVSCVFIYLYIKKETISKELKVYKDLFGEIVENDGIVNVKKDNKESKYISIEKHLIDEKETVKIALKHMSEIVINDYAKALEDTCIVYSNGRKCYLKEDIDNISLLMCKKYIKEGEHKSE